MSATMPTTAAEIIASLHARIDALNLYADTVPTVSVWVILSASGLPLELVMGAGVQRPRIVSLSEATQFRTMAAAARIADDCRDGNGQSARAMTLVRAIEVTRAELEKSLALFKDEH